MAEIGREIGWDEIIENDGPEFIVVPEGDYDFEIIGFERGRHNGSEKLPPCNKAIVQVKVTAPEGTTIIKNQLFLHTSTEGLLCAFFTAIGQRKHGEKLKMDWNKVVGARGRCKVGVRKWLSDKDGREYSGNEIRKFYEPEDKPAAPGFKAGEF